MHAFTDFYFLDPSVKPVNDNHSGAVNMVYGAGDTIFIGW